MTISVGALIANRYEVVKTLAGGMGLVYLCNDRAEDRPVALKTFQPKYLSNRAARDGFLNEGNTWINLSRHPHVVRAHRVEHVGDGREVYIVLDWVAEAEGKRDASLRAWLAPDEKKWSVLKPLPLEQALLFALHIARGMKHALAKVPGLVHRDLKPENVLVGRDGLARVTDFGLAKATEAFQGIGENEGTEKSVSRMQVLPSGIGGTPLYMAPEQWVRGEMLDARADIYAFGCILYEMIVGQFMVVGNNLERLHREGQAAKQALELKSDMGKLVQKCVAVGRNERYGSWAEVEAALVAAYHRVTGKAVPMEVAAETETRAERIGMGWSYNSIGISYRDISKFDVAVGYFERTLKIGRAEKDRALEGGALGNLGMAFAALGDVRRAMGYFEQHLQIAREIGDRLGEGQTLVHLGNVYQSLGNVQQAIEFYDQGLVIARKIGDRAGEGRALGNLGVTYYHLGDVRRAAKYHEQTLIIMREIGDQYGEGMALGNLGSAYLSLGDAGRAIEFYQQHLTIAREIGDRRGEGMALGNLGITYLNLGDAQRAIGFYEQDLQIAREIGDRRGEGMTLGNLGIAYLNLGDAWRAIEFFEQSLNISREVGDAMGAAQTCYNLALLLSKRGEPSEALRHAEFAAQVFKQAKHAPMLERTQELIVQILRPRR